MYILKDNYNRVFSYLRLSVTDMCNFNCKYCLPDVKKFDKKSYLSLNEIRNLISAFADLGISKVRLTGGEPTIRKDFLDIGSIISEFSCVKSLVFTTNGYRLYKIIKDVVKVGFTGVNISLDSLDRKKFFVITGKDLFTDVIKSIFLSLDSGLIVKVNAVLSKFFSSSDFEYFYSLLKYKNFTVRFIDQMETLSIKRYTDNQFSSVYLIDFLLKNGWYIFKADYTAGPAILFKHQDFLGNIGIINPYSNHFCNSCNRLRVSACGDLYLCLFGGEGYSVRKFLSSSNNKNDLICFLLDTIKLKSKSHYLHDKNFGLMETFSSIGG